MSLTENPLSRLCGNDLQRQTQICPVYPKPFYKKSYTFKVIGSRIRHTFSCLHVDAYVEILE